MRLTSSRVPGADAEHQNDKNKRRHNKLSEPGELETFASAMPVRLHRRLPLIVTISGSIVPLTEQLDARRLRIRVGERLVSSVLTESSTNLRAPLTDHVE